MTCRTTWGPRETIPNMVSWLRFLDYITPEVAGQVPGGTSPARMANFADIPNGLASRFEVPGPSWLQILAYCLYCESGSFRHNADLDREPGELGWRPFSLYTAEPGGRQRRLSVGIANGRLGMEAIIGSAWGDWALDPAPPLRGFESTLGSKVLARAWCPAGLSKNGDAAAVGRLRSNEVTHGRVGMLATTGCITPEVTGKFPGLLSPSRGLVFEIVIHCLHAEASGLGFDDIGQGELTPGDVGWKPPLLSDFDGEAKARMLNAGIANGWLAKVAIIGMFFQGGLIGSARCDWANTRTRPCAPSRARRDRNASPPAPPRPQGRSS